MRFYRKSFGYKLTTIGKHSYYNLVTIPIFHKIPIGFSAKKTLLKHLESDLESTLV